MKKNRICAIAAMDETRVIGVRGGLPWRHPEDLKRFKALTTGQTVVMGRKTFDSLPAKSKPLPGRHNIVLTRGKADPEFPSVEWRSGVDECLQELSVRELPLDSAWVLGGAEIYRATLPFWTDLYLTVVPGSHEGDAFFPPFEEELTLESAEQGETCRFLHYRRGSGR